MPISRATRLAVPLLIAAAAGSRAQAQGADRYGNAPTAYPAPAAVGAAPLRGRMLAWPGKQTPSAMTAPPQAYATEAAPPPRPYQPSSRFEGMARPISAYASAPPRPWGRASEFATTGQTPGRYGAGGYPAPAAAPPAYGRSPSADGWRPVLATSDRQPQPALAGAPSPAPLPTSIYSPPSAPAEAAPALSPAARAAALGPPMRGSAAQRYGYDPTQDHTVRFYSVHRAFGLQPDPAPIPPQFFTATADLATPPGPLTTERTTTTSASGATTHAVRATPDAGTD